MEEKTFIIEPDNSGIRIDKYIALKLGEEYSRVYAKFLIDNGFALVNNKKVKPHRIIHEGEKITLELKPQDSSSVEPEDIPLNIIYEDDWLIVIDKSAGMVVHPGSGNKTGTLVNALLYHCGKLADTGDELRPGIVHRLDKDTSGVIVVAKNDRSMRSLAKQFQNRAIKKCYVAIVKGRVELDNGIIDAPLARHAIDRKKMDIEYTKGKEARTVYHVEKRFDDFTLVRLEPETGRTHQIRVHMKYLGYPLVGDVRYGGGKGMARHALHAEKLGFTHPDTGKYVEFTSPIPKDMLLFLEKGNN